MRSKLVAFLPADLGVTKTHSRVPKHEIGQPYTSTDNPYSEAQFKTLKYQPDFPEHFRRMFSDWYNHEQPNSGIGLMTPATVHYGRAAEHQDHCAPVLAAAYANTPERFVRGIPQPPELPTAARINPHTTKEVAH